MSWRLRRRSTTDEFHLLREIAIKTVRHLGIVGECNIQYALNPKTSDYRVIEVNARLSRSSALASKATGYPLAFVSTKLSLGIRLDEIKNAVTKKTTAFFEPALDYLVLKMPRWDIHKLKSADRNIGSEMKSVGEVMAIGRSFPEVLQKAIRMLNIGASGLTDYPWSITDPIKEISQATDRRIFALHEWFKRGGSVDEANKLSHIDPWFLHHLASIAKVEAELPNWASLSRERFIAIKQHGFSDKAIAKLRQSDEKTIRKQRINKGIIPSIKQIDTLAGEFAAETNYLYTTYHGQYHDVEPSRERPLLVLGSGPTPLALRSSSTGAQSTPRRTLRKNKKPTIIVNSNPETVSTDYDESDRLYFEEPTFERIQDIAEFETPKGIIVSVGGQIANNLVLPFTKPIIPFWVHLPT